MVSPIFLYGYGSEESDPFLFTGELMSDWEAAKETLFFIFESFGDLFDWLVQKLQDFLMFFVIFIAACILLGYAIVFIS
jgi:hypothetical protein